MSTTIACIVDPLPEKLTAPPAAPCDISDAAAGYVSPANLKILTPAALDSVCAKESKRQFIVGGLIPRGAIGIAVGDSGLGKSPLFYQLALCVAAGVPWLGMATRRGPVLYIDSENGELASRDLRDALVRHLRLAECPDNFLSLFEATSLDTIDRAAASVKPALIVVDTLRSFDPAAEADNTKAGQLLLRLRKICNRYKTSVLLIHHIKKPSEGTFSVSLERDPVMQWLNQACGARALVNQTDFRIGIDRSAKATTALLVRAQLRVHGEVGPMYLAREFDEDEEPLGYRRLTGVELLDNADQQAAFEKLPLGFSFKEAKASYGRHDEATKLFLEKCIAAGILFRPSRGRYEKTTRATGVTGVLKEDKSFQLLTAPVGNRSASE